LEGGSYEQTLGQAEGDFISQVVDLSAAFLVGGSALLLQVFGVLVEDFEGRRAGGLHGVGSAEREGWSGDEETPADGGARQEGPQGYGLHGGGLEMEVLMLQDEGPMMTFTGLWIGL